MPAALDALKIPEPQCPIEELLARDPLEMAEAELEKVTRTMVKLCREDIRIWNQEKETAVKKGKGISGSRTKKKQLTAKQQLLAAELASPDFDPFS